ncbi:uncharacterized protein LOC106381233 isoform X3 [Brassica napus]|uniref:uncharacterized protein LOC106381233 isoform X3 n=1 Tax=Brassica napus TaxID=3708 RepID=UPI000BBEC79A|nr:uncharacterized protein LOC106381233 isoform X3 [Brassica napus]
MKRNLWLIALFLVLSFVISSYAASTHPYQIRKLLDYPKQNFDPPIGAYGSTSPTGPQCC